MSLCESTLGPENEGTFLPTRLEKLNLKRTIQEVEDKPSKAKSSSIMKTLYAVDGFTSLLGNHPTVDCISESTALRYGFLSHKRSRRNDNDLQHYDLMNKSSKFLNAIVVPNRELSKK